MLTPLEQALLLLHEGGPGEAWQRATREATNAHLRRDESRREFWRSVLEELVRMAPRPGPGNLDIDRSAKLLIGQLGVEEALRHARQRAIDFEGDLIGQALWLRIADAIADFA